MRRPIAILAALALLVSIPAAVSAGKPFRETDHTGSVYCDGIAPTSGSGFMYFGMFFSELYGTDAFMDLWTSAEPTGFPDYSRDYDQPIDASGTIDAFTVTFPVVDSNGNPAGIATVTGTTTPVGEPSEFDDDYRFGNINVRSHFIVQPRAVEGSVQVAGRTFSLGDCFADDTVVTSFSTNPNAYTERFARADSQCDIENADGTLGFVFIDASSDVVFIDAVLYDGPGSPLEGFGEVVVVGGTGSGSLSLFDPETGADLPGEATIDLALTQGSTYAYALKDRGFRELNRGTLIDVEGTLTFPDMPPFDLSNCVAFSGTTKVIVTNPQGPKPKGKAPANDVPSGALALAVGGRTREATRATVVDQEAAYPCMEFYDPFLDQTEVIPVEHTVWFRIAGTGSEVTVDTAGSDYDTVAAAYVSDGAGGYTPIACVDDVALDPYGFSFQSAVTFATSVGTTYYVQIGGYPSPPSYGNLTVAVR